MSDFFYKPLHEKVLVLPKERNTKTSGGIIKVVDDANIPDYGTVVAVSDLVDYIKVGDVLMFEHGTGKPINNGDTKYVLLDCSKHGSVLGIV